MGQLRHRHGRERDCGAVGDRLARVLFAAFMLLDLSCARRGIDINRDDASRSPVDSSPDATVLSSYDENRTFASLRVLPLQKCYLRMSGGAALIAVKIEGSGRASDVALLATAPCCDEACIRSVVLDARVPSFMGDPHILQAALGPSMKEYVLDGTLHHRPSMPPELTLLPCVEWCGPGSVDATAKKWIPAQ
jgi:hypothetical protein